MKILWTFADWFVKPRNLLPKLLPSSFIFDITISDPSIEGGTIPLTCIENTFIIFTWTDSSPGIILSLIPYLLTTLKYLTSTISPFKNGWGVSKVNVPEDASIDATFTSIFLFKIKLSIFLLFWVYPKSFTVNFELFFKMIFLFDTWLVVISTNLILIFLEESPSS